MFVTYLGRNKNLILASAKKTANNIMVIAIRDLGSYNCQFLALRSNTRAFLDELIVLDLVAWIVLQCKQVYLLNHMFEVWCIGKVSVKRHNQSKHEVCDA